MPIDGRLVRRQIDVQRQDPPAAARRVAFVVAVALLLMAPGCGDGGGAVSTDSTGARQSTTADATTPPPRVSLALTTTLGELPLPMEEPAIDARLGTLPAELFGTGRGPVEGGASWYGPVGDFGIEAAEVADTLPGDPSPAELFRHLARRHGARASECASPPARCLSGECDGRHTVAWGHDDSPIASRRSRAATVSATSTPAHRHRVRGLDGSLQGRHVEGHLDEADLAREQPDGESGAIPVPVREGSAVREPDEAGGYVVGTPPGRGVVPSLLRWLRATRMTATFPAV